MEGLCQTVASMFCYSLYIRPADKLGIQLVLARVHTLGISYLLYIELITRLDLLKAAKTKVRNRMYTLLVFNQHSDN